MNAHIIVIIEYYLAFNMVVCLLLRYYLFEHSSLVSVTRRLIGPTDESESMLCTRTRDCMHV